MNLWGINHIQTKAILYFVSFIHSLVSLLSFTQIPILNPVFFLLLKCEVGEFIEIEKYKVEE
jgi:hypothetical protein